MVVVDWRPLYWLGLVWGSLVFVWYDGVWATLWGLPSGGVRVLLGGGPLLYLLVCGPLVGCLVGGDWLGGRCVWVGCRGCQRFAL